MPVKEKTITVKCGYRYKFKDETFKQMNRFYGDRYETSVNAAIDYAANESRRKTPEVYEVYQVYVLVSGKKGSK